MALDLSNNPVRVVPSSVVSLERLETLDLSNTKLPEFPLSLTALPALRVLRYDQRAGNRLVALPDDFAQCVLTSDGSGACEDWKQVNYCCGREMQIAGARALPAEQRA